MKLQWKNKLQRTVMAGVFAALLVVLSQVSIPLPTGIPVTLQTFAVALCGCVLGPAVGSAAVGVYLALGAVGVPVFAGFSGGAGALVGMTGGYLGAQQKNKFLALALGLAGLAVCHGCGAAQFALVMSISPAQAFLAASAPYLVKDVLSLVLAYGAARAVVLALKRARLVTFS